MVNRSTDIGSVFLNKTERIDGFFWSFQSRWFRINYLIVVAPQTCHFIWWCLRVFIGKMRIIPTYRTRLTLGTA